MIITIVMNSELFLFISPASAAPLLMSKSAIRFGQYCCEQERPLICLFPLWSDISECIPLLDQPQVFVRSLSETGLFFGEKGAAAVLNKSRLFGRIDKCIEGIQPGTIAVCTDFPAEDHSGQKALAREMIAFIKSHHPGIPILALDRKGNGQWAGEKRFSKKSFVPLDVLIPARTKKNRPVPDLGRAWQAAGPVLPVWVAPCTGGDALARQLSCFGPSARTVPAATGAFLFMAGSGSRVVTLEKMTAVLGPWLEEKSSDTPFGIQIPICKGFDAERAESLIAHLKPHGLKLILWTPAPEAPDLPRALLWQVSGWGIWNHVSGPALFKNTDPKGMGAWIANNPNIVHSFNSLEFSPEQPPVSKNQLTAPKEIQSYGSLRPPEGIPFWRLLGNAGNILAALCRMELKPLLRLWATLDGQTAFTLGQALEFHYKKPSDIDRKTMDEIVAMVDAGGSVDITHVRANLEKAYLIAYATENGVIAGNSSLKHPRQVFIDRLHQSTGLDFTHFVERGYTSVRPEYRAMGIGARLLEGLTLRATDVKVFSLISEDNLATQKIAIRNKTRKIAVYFSDKVGKKMGVWMPEHMIEDGWEVDS